ncbi:MAG: hypothetical protein DRJ57_02460 [Thermoprotei archaeon]|nr:MAG: hypothetical protein DRJ57_02460 [Thermoprotei archaeon]
MMLQALATWLSLAGLLTGAILSVAGKPGDELVKYYEYDSSEPLNPEIAKVREEDSFTIYKVYYDSVNNVRVPALLIVPKIGKPPYPCIVFLHGYGGSKEDAILLARVAAPRGYAIFSIDAAYHGERSVPGKELYSKDLEDSRRGIIQTVIDLRRGVDLLETLDFIDGDRIGYAGGSMGGIIGAIFVGVEPRIKAAVIVVGGGNMTLMLQKSMHPAIPPIREYIAKIKMSWSEVEELLRPVEPLNFIRRFSPRPIQFHCGRYDRIVPAEAQRQLVEKAGEPKEVYWYDTGHNVPLEEVVPRSLEFFDKYLKGAGKTGERGLHILLILASIAAACIVAYLRYRIMCGGRVA